MKMEMNNFNVSIVRINGEDNFAIKILDEKYLNLVYKYDKLEVVDDVLSFEINVVDNPNNISEEVISNKEFSDFVGEYLVYLLKSQMENDALNDVREHNSEELSKE